MKSWSGSANIHPGNATYWGLLSSDVILNYRHELNLPIKDRNYDVMRPTVLHWHHKNSNFCLYPSAHLPTHRHKLNSTVWFRTGQPFLSIRKFSIKSLVITPCDASTSPPAIEFPQFRLFPSVSEPPCFHNFSRQRVSSKYDPRNWNFSSSKAKASN